MDFITKPPLRFSETRPQYINLIAAPASVRLVIATLAYYSLPPRSTYRVSGAQLLPHILLVHINTSNRQSPWRLSLA